MKIYLFLKTQIQEKNTEALLYVYGIGIAAATVLTWQVLSLITHLTGLPVWEKCPFRTLTGLYCPGCGGSRSILALLHGDVLHSFLLHPAALWLAIIVILFYLSQTLRFLSRGRIPGLSYRPVYVVIFVVLLVLNVIIKNYVLLVYDYPLIP